MSSGLSGVSGANGNGSPASSEGGANGVGVDILRSADAAGDETSASCSLAEKSGGYSTFGEGISQPETAGVSGSTANVLDANDTNSTAEIINQVCCVAQQTMQLVQSNDGTGAQSLIDQLSGLPASTGDGVDMQGDATSSLGQGHGGSGDIAEGGGLGGLLEEIVQLLFQLLQQIKGDGAQGSSSDSADPGGKDDQSYAANDNGGSSALNSIDGRSAGDIEDMMQQLVQLLQQLMQTLLTSDNRATVG